jgi:hypothetical protein
VQFRPSGSGEGRRSVPRYRSIHDDSSSHVCSAVRKNVRLFPPCRLPAVFRSRLSTAYSRSLVRCPCSALQLIRGQLRSVRSQPTRFVPRRHRSSCQFVLCLCWVSLFLVLSTSALEHSFQPASSRRWLERSPRIIKVDTRRLETPLLDPLGAAIVFKDVELICVYLPPLFPIPSLCWALCHQLSLADPDHSAQPSID